MCKGEFQVQSNKLNCIYAYLCILSQYILVQLTCPTDLLSYISRCRYANTRHNRLGTQFYGYSLFQYDHYAEVNFKYMLKYVYLDSCTSYVSIEVSAQRANFGFIPHPGISFYI